jgi:hypothetical protein
VFKPPFSSSTMQRKTLYIFSGKNSAAQRSWTTPGNGYRNRTSYSFAGGPSGAEFKSRSHGSMWSISVAEDVLIIGTVPAGSLLLFARQNYRRG